MDGRTILMLIQYKTTGHERIQLAMVYQKWYCLSEERRPCRNRPSAFLLCSFVPLLGQNRSGSGFNSLPREDRRTIGADLRTLEWGWPVGMPICRPLEKGLWEVRSNLSDGRIGRMIFSIKEGKMVILHGFIKKSQRTPRRDIDLAINRRKDMSR